MIVASSTSCVLVPITSPKTYCASAHHIIHHKLYHGHVHVVNWDYCLQWRDIP